MGEFIVFLLIVVVVYKLGRRMVDPAYAARKHREHVAHQRATIRNAAYQPKKAARKIKGMCSDYLN
jgi:hypothetical protein